MDTINHYIEIENSLFTLSQHANDHCIFILGSPRTGSTILYQALAHTFKLPYIANITNDHFHETPSIGFSIQAANNKHFEVTSESAFGKTMGLFQPSEGSGLMKLWFGGNQPSQTYSKTIDPSKEIHFINTLKYANYVFNKPLLIKNAWNCFRIKNIAQLLPSAFFIWIRRDILDSAKSDLDARYRMQRDPTVWNSATPSNVNELLKRPYWEQVIENQYEFNYAMMKDLETFASNRYMEIWYEDFCNAPDSSLETLKNQCALLKNINKVDSSNNFHIGSKNSAYQFSQEDNSMIMGYFKENEQRLSAYKYNHEYRNA